MGGRCCVTLFSLNLTNLEKRRQLCLAVCSPEPLERLRNTRIRNQGHLEGIFQCSREKKENRFEHFSTWISFFLCGRLGKEKSHRITKLPHLSLLLHLNKLALICQDPPQMLLPGALPNCLAEFFLLCVHRTLSIHLSLQVSHFNWN